MTSVLKSVLLFQGLYYSLTGLWAIVDLDNFSRATNHFGDAFEMHSIAALAVVLGLFFIWSSVKEELRKPAGFLLIGMALAVVIPEAVYLPRMHDGVTLFWVDFVEEIVIILLTSFSLLARSKRSS